MSTDLEDDGAPRTKPSGSQHLDAESAEQSTAGYAPGAEPTAPSPVSATGGSPQLIPGHRIAGRFVILRFIARGGMGEVYEALDSELGSHVAVKTILPALASDPGVVERFRREVLLARRVTHTNVCRVFELYSTETDSGEPLKFLTMEFLDGESLAQRLKRIGRVTAKEAFPILRQVAAALDAAHSQGVIHRDFKPSNVMLVPAGSAAPGEPTNMRAVVTDFGIARALAPVPESDTTQTGAVLGTPQYMAPEQLVGGSTTAATDIYALGVVMHEMVTGQLPLLSGAGHVAGGSRPASGMKPGLGPRWKATIRRCLERDPERRFKSVLDVLRALDRPTRLRPRVVGGASLLLALVLATLVVTWYRLDIRQQESDTGGAQSAIHFPRRSVALLPLRDRSSKPESTWIWLALVEGLSIELRAAERDLLAIRDQRVERFAVASPPADFDARDAATRQRFRHLLSADVLVSGEYSLDAGGVLRTDVTAVESATGKLIAEWSDQAPVEEVEQLVTRMGKRLREAFGASGLTPAELNSLAAARPRRFEAARLHAEGGLRNLRWDYNGASRLLVAAVAVDPDYVEALRDLAEVTGILGEAAKAKEVSQRVSQLAPPLSLLERVSAGAMHRRYSFGPSLMEGLPTDALEVHRERFRRFPDDLNVARPLVLREPPQAALLVVEALRRLPPPASEDLRLDTWEAQVRQGTDEFGKAEMLLRAAIQKAEELGSLEDLAIAYDCLASVLADNMMKPAAMLEPLTNAARVEAERGNLRAAAYIKLNIAEIADDQGQPDLARRSTEEGLATFRRFGNRFWIHDALLVVSRHWLVRGDLRRAQAFLTEARSEWSTAGGEPLWSDVAESGSLELLQGDLVAARRSLSEANQIAGRRGQWGPSELEAAILREEDSLEEARAVVQRNLDRYQSPYDRHYRLELQAMLARLECDQGRTKEGLDHIAAIGDAHANDAPERAFDRAVEGGCLLGREDLQGAERAAREGLAAAALAGRFSERVANATTLALVQSGRGDGRAVHALRALLAEAEPSRYLYVLETRLGLGRAELDLGRLDGRKRLEALEAEARSKGFVRIARLAREELDRRPFAHRGPNH